MMTNSFRNCLSEAEEGTDLSYIVWNYIDLRETGVESRSWEITCGSYLDHGDPRLLTLSLIGGIRIYICLIVRGVEHGLGGYQCDQYYGNTAHIRPLSTYLLLNSWSIGHWSLVTTSKLGAYRNMNFLVSVYWTDWKEGGFENRINGILSILCGILLLFYWTLTFISNCSFVFCFKHILFTTIQVELQELS